MALDKAGNVLESDDLNFKIDFTPPVISKPNPPQNGWANNKEFNCTIEVSDSISGVDKTLIEFRTSKIGSGNYSSWQKATVTDAPIIKGVGKGNFELGAENSIQWRATDLAGNVIVSPDFRIYLDFIEVIYSNAKPSIDLNPANWSKNLEVNCGITIDDGVNSSGVDAPSIQYRYSVNGTDDSEFTNWTTLSLTPAENAEKVTVDVDLTFNHGVRNYIQWRARDIAGNGWTESNKYNVQVPLHNLTR